MTTTLLPDLRNRKTYRRRVVLAALEDHPQRKSEIAELTGIKPIAFLDRALAELRASGDADVVKGGRWVNPHFADDEASAA